MTDLAPDPLVLPESDAERGPDVELRVLAGRAAGARANLAEGAEVSVGHALDCDIVVRDPAARGVLLKLRPGPDCAELEVLSGQVEFLGHVLTAPARAILPAYVPLHLGGTAVALGRADGARWPEAEQLLRPGQPEVAEPIVAAPSALWRELLGVARKTPLAPILTGVAALAMLGALYIGAPAIVSLADPSPGPGDAKRILRAGGYPTLTVTQSPDGRLTIHGLVARTGDRARLETLIQARGLRASLDVRSGDDIALGVSEVLRTHGVTAEVKPAGLGVVSVAVSSGGEPERLEAARRIALRDVGGLKRVLFAAGPGLGGSVLDEDPKTAGAKRVLSVVAGDGGYVQTADGARYFMGAVLPTGHTITAIADRDVTVQRDGKITHLLF